MRPCSFDKSSLSIGKVKSKRNVKLTPLYCYQSEVPLLSFQGKIPHKVLRIHSTFDNYLYIDRVAFQPNDSRFTYEPPKDLTGPPVLEPGDTATVGRIYFNAKKECKEDCYVGLPTYTPGNYNFDTFTYFKAKDKC